MKKILFTTAALLMFCLTASAQWNTTGNHIFNTNTLNVGIGNGSSFTPAEKLTVFGNILTNNAFILDATGTQNQIYFRQNGVLKSQLTSNFSDGNFYLFHQGANRFLIDQNGNVGVGSFSTAPIFSATGMMFRGVTPKMEILTGAADSGYSELVTIRHGMTGPISATRQLGLILKLSGEQSAVESNKMGGMMLESTSNVYSNGPNLSFLTANQKRMTIHYNGNIGIGMESPVSKFAVLGNGASVPNSPWINAGNPVATFFGESTVGNGDFLLGFAGNTTRSVFIGRRSRGTLAAPVAVQAGDQLASFLGSGYDGTTFLSPGELGFVVDGAVTTSTVPTAIVFNNSTGGTRSERMRISSAGNVGIGTTAPLAALHVAGTNAGAVIEDKTALAAGVGGAISLRGVYNSAGETAAFATIKAGKIDNQSGDASSYLAFGTRNGTTPLEAMRITNLGRVGIGTTSADAPLQLNGPLAGGTSLSIGLANSPGNIQVPIGSATGGYNIDFHGYRDVVTNQTGARIRAERINNYQANNALIQSMDLAFSTSTGMDTTYLTEKMRIKSNGKIGIGTKNPDEMLTVNGTIHTKEVKVDLNIPAPDYVFYKNYDLRPLADVSKYIQANGHLPEIPSAKTMEQNGVNLGEMNMQLLKKVEELTLYLIQEQKQRQELELRLQKMEAKLNNGTVK